MDIYKEERNRLKSNLLFTLMFHAITFSKEEFFMTRLRRATLWGIVGMSVWALSAQAWAASDSPTELIRAGIDRARAVLENPAYQGNDRRQQRLEKVKEAVLSLFDSQEIAKRTLGVYWKDRTEAEQKEFIEVFTALVEKTYASSLDRYRKDFQVIFEQERIEDNFAEVDSRIVDPTQQKTFTLNYRLHKIDGKWLIYDLVIENVSLVRNYRNQFHRILGKKSYEELVETIRTKIQQLDTVPQTGTGL
jgi:phospholipid transport system substrate-binding protein